MSIVSSVGAERYGPHRCPAATGQREGLLLQRRIAQQLSEIGVEAPPPEGRLGRLADQRRNGIDLGKERSQLGHQQLVRVGILAHVPRLADLERGQFRGAAKLI